MSHSVTTLLSESGIIAEADWQNMTDSFPGKRGKKRGEMLGTEDWIGAMMGPLAAHSVFMCV